MDNSRVVGPRACISKSVVCGTQQISSGVDGVVVESKCVRKCACKNCTNCYKQLDCAITAEGKIFVEDVFRHKIESPEIIPKAKQMASKYNWSYVCIENQGLSKPFVQEALRAGLKVNQVRAEKDKITKSYHYRLGWRQVTSFLERMHHG